ncbi:MAG: DUF1801 domain-containing protein [Calditrichaeota bacterium]|nr:DUF1801 domain-containing protein [Calditrichota bacterium]MCB9369128.1 DUF1801 domain-containing protein [Calditrichota bacterium]
MAKDISKKPSKVVTKTTKGVTAKAAERLKGADQSKSASQLIDSRIRDLGDWRGETLAKVRALVLETVPDVTEEWKWRGVPVWSSNGIVCTGETYKEVVKLTFAKGAQLPDPAKLFNSSLDGNVRRAIDIREGEKINTRALKALVKAAAALNSASVKKPKAASKPKLLAGGNPQVAKADGNAPVQAYIKAIPAGWKRKVSADLDALIKKNVPKVCMAVKWNSPFYGMEGQGWFASFHVFTKYVKLTFFKGTSLKPAPSGGDAQEARWINIHEGEKLNEKQLAAWIKQASKLPGWGGN